MKKNMNTVLAALALALALSSCAGSGGNAEASAEETAAETTVSAPETAVSDDTAAESTASSADAETEESVEAESPDTEDETVSAVEYEISGYGRTYPGLDDEDVRFTANAEFIHITTPGHDALQASLDELNSANRRQADEAFSQLYPHRDPSGKREQYAVPDPRKTGGTGRHAPEESERAGGELQKQHGA